MIQYMHRCRPLVMRWIRDDTIDKSFFVGEILVSCDTEYDVGMTYTFHEKEVLPVDNDQRVAPYSVIDKAREMLCLVEHHSPWWRVHDRILDRIKRLRELEDSVRNYHPGAHTSFPDAK
jgi:hypothetical protein